MGFGDIIAAVKDDVMYECLATFLYDWFILWIQDTGSKFIVKFKVCVVRLHYSIHIYL